MVRKVVRPLLLGISLLALTLVAMTACSPTTDTGQGQVYPPPAPATAAASASGDAVADASSERQAEPTEVLTSSVSVTEAQPLNWGIDAENCIMPGLVITGSDVELPPCETDTEAGDAGNDEAATPETQREEISMPEETPSPDSQAAESVQPQAQDPYAAKMTALAVDDLSQRLGIPADEIEVREVREVTWPDSSLGCPQPDMMYAQMLQEGLSLTLYADGETYSYHSGGDQPPFLCEDTFEHPPSSR